MKLAYTKFYRTRDEAVAQAGAAKREGRKVVITGPVQIIRHGNEAGDMNETPNPDDKDMWLMVVSDVAIDVSLL